MNTQIERKIPAKITPSPAVLAVTLGALANVANAGLKINVDSSKVDFELSEHIQTALANDQLKKDVQDDYGFDFSIFQDKLFIDDEQEKISEELLMFVAGLSNRVDADSTYCDDDTAGICWDTGCYTNCHSNCHGSRSWR